MRSSDSIVVSLCATPLLSLTSITGLSVPLMCGWSMARKGMSPSLSRRLCAASSLSLFLRGIGMARAPSASRFTAFKATVTNGSLSVVTV